MRKIRGIFCSVFYYPRVDLCFIFAVNVQKDSEENNEARPDVTETKNIKSLHDDLSGLNSSGGRLIYNSPDGCARIPHSVFDPMSVLSGTFWRIRPRK